MNHNPKGINLILAKKPQHKILQSFQSKEPFWCLIINLIYILYQYHGNINFLKRFLLTLSD